MNRLPVLTMERKPLVTIPNQEENFC